MLFGNSLLDKIPQLEQALIRPLLRKVALSKGAVLMEPGQAPSHFYFPTAGLISCMASTHKGQQLEVYAAGASDIVGFAGFWKHSEQFRAKVQLAGEAMALDVREFLAMFHRIAEFRELVFSCLGMQWTKVAQRVCCAHFHEVLARVSLWLALASGISHRDNLDCTHQALAEAIGVRRATVTTSLGQLERAGAIRCDRGQIHIADPQVLHIFACECLPTLLPDSNL